MATRSNQAKRPPGATKEGVAVNGIKQQKSIRLGAVGLLVGVFLIVGMSGCAGLWDEITSNNRDLHGYFFKPDPLVIIRDSNDGAKRGQALATLKEPLQNGGNQADQEVYIKILTVAATSDREPLCRLGAIRALAGYKDPRAARALEDVYQQRLPFGPDFNTVIRQQALASLEKTGDPDSRHLLIRVARQPGGAVEASQIDRQQTLDERLTAIRALAKYKQADAIETLVYLMETEKDVAIKGRAHESLQTATGKNLPADARAWRELMANPASLAQEPNLIQRVMGTKW
jgi:hypothetical protein